MAHDLSNPHPGHGKDPNIANEFGHTHYPKYIEVDGKRVVANDENHEAELLGTRTKPSKKGDWKD